MDRSLVNSPPLPRATVLPLLSLFHASSELEETECFHRGASLEERRHRDEQLRFRLWCLLRDVHHFEALAPLTQFAGHSKAQAHCLRSGRLVPSSSSYPATAITVRNSIYFLYRPSIKPCRSSFSIILVLMKCAGLALRASALFDQSRMFWIPLADG